MNWNLAIDDYLVNQYTPKLQMDSGLYKVEDAAVIGIPENYYIDGDTSNFAVSVSNAESLINSWKIAFTGEEVGDLSVKNAEMYFEIIDNSILYTLNELTLMAVFEAECEPCKCNNTTESEVLHMKKTHGLDEREMELVKLLMADCQTTGTFRQN